LPYSNIDHKNTGRCIFSKYIATIATKSRDHSFAKNYKRIPFFGLKPPVSRGRDSGNLEFGREVGKTWARAFPARIRTQVLPNDSTLTEAH